MKTSLQSLLAEKIRESLPEFWARNRRVTADNLCLHFGVSRTTMLRSLAILRDRGVVRYGRGSPIRPGSSLGKATNTNESSSEQVTDGVVTDPEAYSSTTAAYRVYQAIKDQIIRGEWANEDLVPKTGYLVHTFSCSKSTAHRALQILLEDGLITRFGRGYRVGADRVQSIAFQTKGSVFVVQYDSFTWPRIQNGKWGDQFVGNVFTSLSGSGLEVHVADLQRSGIRHGDFARPTGEQDIEDAVRRLTSPLLGFICLFSVFDFPPPAYKHLEASLEWLSRFGKPIVWFDSTEEIGGLYRRSRKVTESFGAFLKSGRLKAPLFRCRPDQAEAFGVALHILEEHGHRRIGLALFRPRVEWMRYRLHTINRIRSKNMRHIHLAVGPGRKNPIPLTMNMTIEDFRTGIPTVNRKGIAAMLARLSAEYIGKPLAELPEDERDLIIMTRVLLPIIESEECTALLLPNDHAARRVLHWCVAAGIRIPRELSILSFDDRFEEQYPYVISSVNFGFERLGRIAVGILRGQQPLRIREYRGVPSIPRLNHQMTIGPVR